MYCSGRSSNPVTSDLFLFLLFLLINNLWLSFPVCFKYGVLSLYETNIRVTSLAVSSVNVHSSVVFLYCCTFFNCLSLPPLNTHDVIYQPLDSLLPIARATSECSDEKRSRWRFKPEPGFLATLRWTACTFKDLYSRPIVIIKGLTYTEQFWHLTGLKGPFYH